MWHMRLHVYMYVYVHTVTTHHVPAHTKKTKQQPQRGHNEPRPTSLPVALLDTSRSSQLSYKWCQEGS